MSQECFDYINRNKPRFLEELKQFLSFPSISMDTAYRDDLRNCALWLVSHLKSIGLDSRLIETKGHPIVWAKSKGRSDKKLIIYGHYDVQPAGVASEWKTNPFDAAIRDGFIYARGATDDKGQIFAHIKAVESVVKAMGYMPCDVVFLIEGEEECGMDSLEQYIKAEKANLAADAVVVSDTSLYGEDTPAIAYGLRGTMVMQLKVTTAARDLHSGTFGGAIGNAVSALSHIISKCITPDGLVHIPGFYDQVRPLAKWEKDNFRALAFDDNTLIKEAGAKKIFGDSAFSTLQRLWTRPTFEINGISGGYEGEGFKTIIPSSATAKISIRLVPDQDPSVLADPVTRYIRSVCPDFANIEFEGPFATDPILFDIDNPMIKAGWQALKHGFGKEPVYIRCGGSIPVVNAFWRELKTPIVLIGFGLDSDGAHSTNERFKIDNFLNGVKTSAWFITNM